MDNNREIPREKGPLNKVMCGKMSYFIYTLYYSLRSFISVSKIFVELLYVQAYTFSSFCDPQHLGYKRYECQHIITRQFRIAYTTEKDRMELYVGWMSCTNVFFAIDIGLLPFTCLITVLNMEALFRRKSLCWIIRERELFYIQRHINRALTCGRLY